MTGARGGAKGPELIGLPPASETGGEGGLGWLMREWLVFVGTTAFFALALVMSWRLAALVLFVVVATALARSLYATWRTVRQRTRC